MRKFRMLLFCRGRHSDERHDRFRAGAGSSRLQLTAVPVLSIAHCSRHRFRDRGVWWRARPVAHRRGSLRRRGA